MAGRKRATDSSRNDGIQVTIETFDGSRATGTFSGTLDAAPSHPTDPLYRTINQNLYWGFGTFGAAIEVGAVLSSIVLAFVVRGRRPAFSLTLTAAVLVVAAHLVFWVFIAPVNAEIASWAPGSVPAGWASVRDRWEFSHATRAVLMVVAFGFLLASVLAETPSRTADQARRPSEDELLTRIPLLNRRPTG